MVPIFQNIEYTDERSDSNRFFLASYSLIDIYENNQLIKRISIDDIDGIRFLSLNGNILHGEFREIDQADPDIWISFELNTMTLDFTCDYGRMWEDITYINGKENKEYLTMGVKNA